MAVRRLQTRTMEKSIGGWEVTDKLVHERHSSAVNDLAPDAGDGGEALWAEGR